MNAVLEFFRSEFRPPDYLALPTAGVDVSQSGIKVVTLVPKMHGLEVRSMGEAPLPKGAIVGGEMTDRKTVVETIQKLAKEHHFSRANIALPETRGYLFEAVAPEGSKNTQKVAIEQHLDEHVPLPAQDVVFDIAPLEKSEEGEKVVGVGYARRVVEEAVSAFEEAGIEVRSAESEMFALPRALLPEGSDETVLIVDIGKSTTKLLVVTARLPRFVTTLEVGGHALTLAIHKYFGASEEEAKKIKMERGIMPEKGNEEYLAAMLSTVSVIRDELSRRLDYWQTHAEEEGYPKVNRVLLVGGNAGVRGLPEYFEQSLHIPVTRGDVYRHLAPLSVWHPPIEGVASLAYATALGLALREYDR